MSHQCSCGRDLNNNYVGYTSAYANANTSLDRESSGSSSKNATGPQAQFTAKIIVGTVGAIKELREKEKSRQTMTRADAMISRKRWFLAFVVFNELMALRNCQEYLKDLKPKEFKYISVDELPPVECPRPIVVKRFAKNFNDEQSGEEQTNTVNRPQNSERTTLMEIALEVSVQQGLNAMRHLYSEVEPNMVKNGQLLQANHPAALLSKFSAPLVETTKREMAAYATLTAAKIFRKSYDLNNDLARQAHSQKVSLRRTALENLCPPRDPPICMPASDRYRTHDGTCNNKKRLRWGAAQMPFNRFLPPEYGDGVDSTRRAVNGGPLSSSRFVSLLVHGARDGEAPLTLMVVQWGQLLDHDMTSTAQPRSINGSVPSCCGNKDFHPSCFPIKVPVDDPWLSPLKVRCLEFLRSAAAQRRDCVLSWREQTNQATAFIDASPIYSSSVKNSDNARVFRKGLLIFGRGNPADDACQRGALATHCIRSGDGRSGEQPGLLALHHVWVLEHNRIAMKLSEINLHWSDEKIYQETRRIIGAMFQHITFREFLPIVLGREVLKLFDLELLNSGYYQGYDPKINPTVSNAFAAAAFRFGHSLVQSSYMRCDRFHNVINTNVSLHEEFQRGDIGSVGSLHRLLRGMATQRALKRDEFITPELTNHLFQTPGFPFGLDLAAINIQRGRDHGLPPYTQWRMPCGLSPINTWEEFAIVVGPESARRISHAYQSVYDIDLFVGGIAERPVVGGLVGPTFACIIAQQFSNSRKGDRFWYENSDFESSFTPAQLLSIRKVSLASILCRSVGGGTFQPHIFLPPQLPNNERLPCGNPPLDDFDIEPWLEQDPFAALGITHPPERQPSQPTFRTTTFKPHPVPDRIFDITQMETKLPDSPLRDHKVGFTNRRPAITVIKDVPFRPPLSNGFLVTRNFSKINDKLDLNQKGHTAHITKQKPVPGVNNKLDKNNHKGGNRHGVIPNTTRRTLIVNNIPIELRNANRDKVKRGPSNLQSEVQPRLGNKDILADTDNATLHDTKKYERDPLKPETNMKTKATQNMSSLDLTKLCTDEMADLEATKHITKAFILLNEKQDKKKIKAESENSRDREEALGKTKLNETQIMGKQNIQEKLTAKVTIDVNENLNRILDKDKLENDEQTASDANFLHDLQDTENTKKTCTNWTNLHCKTDQLKPTSVELKLTPIDDHEYSDSANRETPLKKTNNKTKLDLKNITTSDHNSDFDIDPMVQTIPVTHKRVQRKLTLATSLDQLKDKLKTGPIKTETTRKVTQLTSSTNRSVTTKSPKFSRTTLKTFEQRQYQSRPSYSKTPQKVIVDSVSGDNQYEIEINIRQTNKSPKPVQTTPHRLDYTNAYKPNQIDRYTNLYQTTPIYAYYQPPPTQISSLTQNQRTKPPTIIFVDKHEDHKTSKLPGFLQSVVGWNSATKRPLPASIGYKDKPSLETVIGSPHSAVSHINPPSHLGSPAASSSFSQAQVDPAGFLQASSTSVINGNFGSIAGFASANGADSTFSFNIRPKPDRIQNDAAASYGLHLPQPNPWYTQNYPTEQQYTNFALPFREVANSPFSTSNKNFYPNKNHGGVQRKEDLTLTPAHDFNDYDYSGRTPETLGNITSAEDTNDTTEDYEYDEDYGTSILIGNFSRDNYLRPEHVFETEKDSAKNVSIFNDNYILPVLNMTKNLPKEINADLPKPNDSNFSTDFPESLAKHLQTDILAEEDNSNDNTNTHELPVEAVTQIKLDVLRDMHRKRNQNRNKNNKRRKHEKIAFAPINILTKPERPDNWIFFDSPKPHLADTALPQVPELVVDPVPSAEIPKPFKENIWLDLSNFKRTELQKLEKTLTDRQ